MNPDLPASQALRNDILIHVMGNSCLVEVGNPVQQAIEHAGVAVLLSMVEARPPGFNVGDWAFHLMDQAPVKLRQRLREWIQREESNEVLDVLQEEGSRILPQLPAELPSNLRPKVEAMQKERVHGWLLGHCYHALREFTGQKRTPSKLREAQRVVQRVFGMCRDELGRDLGFTGKIRWRDDGRIEVTLKEA